MHYSQVGAVPSKLLARGLGPQGHLLNDTCLGCHTGTNNLIPSATPTVAVPMVYTTGPTELAGGNFKHSDFTSQRNGHNPVELAGGVDSTLTAPPGWTTGFSENGQVGGGSASWTGQLTCAGVWGCHGEHTDKGISGAHHNHPANGINGQPGTATGSSYRFLYRIKGYEDADYEAETAINHNAYQGVARNNDTHTDAQTISYLCAECHGIFHSNGGGVASKEGVADVTFASPWIRHPVDISMRESGEYSGYNAYRTDAPLAMVDPSAPQHATASTSVAGGDNRIVMCLSCHRAHASPYFASMRWDYRGTAGSWTNGCSYCHTSKN